MNQQKLHIAIIPDGNRRWAKEHGMLPWNGHEKAMENFESLVEWCRQSGKVHTLTIWGFSTENWKRDKKEVEKLMTLFEKYLRKERITFIERNTRFMHAGRSDRIPASLRTLIDDVTKETKDQTGFTFQIALDYGGKDEIKRAIERMQADSSPVTEESIRAHLDQPELPDIDLIIRTSGEYRTSNFFLWQSTYAEWIFSPLYFPVFDTHALAAAIEEYAKRKRRFGS